jgi:hypothetical protein
VLRSSIANTTASRPKRAAKYALLCGSTSSIAIRKRWLSRAARLAGKETKMHPSKTLYPSNNGSILMVSDLKDDEAWMRTHDERRAWGREFADFYVLDQDYVVLIFRPDGAKSLVW